MELKPIKTSDDTINLVIYTKTSFHFYHYQHNHHAVHLVSSLKLAVTVFNNLKLLLVFFQKG